MWCPRARLRRTAVLVLLALRAGRRTIEEEGGLRRPRRLGEGEVRPPASDGRLPSKGGTGVRPATSEDRGPRRSTYLHLEVRGQGLRRPREVQVVEPRDHLVPVAALPIDASAGRAAPEGLMSGVDARGDKVLHLARGDEHEDFVAEGTTRE